MQTFIVKIVGDKFTPGDIKHMIWHCSDLAKEEIIVNEE